MQVLDQLAAEKRSPSKQSPPPPSPPLPHLYTRLEISNSKFDLFEFSRSNLLKYFAKLIVDKILQVTIERYYFIVCLQYICNSVWLLCACCCCLQLIGAKKTTIAQALAKSQPPHTDTFLGHLLVLIQFSWSHSPRAVAQSMRVYEEIVQVIEARETFEYRDFFAFVYSEHWLITFNIYVIFHSSQQFWQFYANRYANIARRVHAYFAAIVVAAKCSPLSWRDKRWTSRVDA